MRRILLVDNSVLQRVQRSAPVASALVELLEHGDLGGCLPQILEEGYSARSASDHEALIDASSRARIFLAPDARSPPSRSTSSADCSTRASAARSG